MVCDDIGSKEFDERKVLGIEKERDQWEIRVSEQPDPSSSMKIEGKTIE